VAIKTCTRNTGLEDVEREARVFQKLTERHMNIVNMLGVCLHPDLEVPPMLLLELCEGNLEKHLHRNCTRFREDDQESGGNLLNPTGEFSSRTLLKYCYQVSKGMEFLEQHKIMHGDLATRNILLAKEKTVAKVADFGLSRSLYTSVEELATVSSGFPVRWMAPEVLKTRQVTKKSDIWSFGVLMWEIFSLGAVPYPEVSQIDMQFVSDLSSGRRQLGTALYRVERLQERLDNIRLAALSINHTDRPDFRQLSEDLWAVLSDSSQSDYQRLQAEYRHYISLINSSYETVVQGGPACLPMSTSL